MGEKLDKKLAAQLLSYVLIRADIQRVGFLMLDGAGEPTEVSVCAEGDFFRIDYQAHKGYAFAKRTAALSPNNIQENDNMASQSAGFGGADFKWVFEADVCNKQDKVTLIPTKEQIKGILLLGS